MQFLKINSPPIAFPKKECNRHPKFSPYVLYLLNFKKYIKWSPQSSKVCLLLHLMRICRRPFTKHSYCSMSVHDVIKISTSRGLPYFCSQYIHTFKWAIKHSECFKCLEIDKLEPIKIFLDSAISCPSIGFIFYFRFQFLKKRCMP